MLKNQPIYSVGQIRALEHAAIVIHSIPEEKLMQHAGFAAFRLLCQLWPVVRNVAVFCGAGNNGGDGYVLAALAMKAGFLVTVYMVGDIQKQTEVSRAAASSCRGLGVRILPLHDFTANNVELIVDAVLGIGIAGEVHGESLQAIQMINACNVPVFAIDIPSGLDADTGEVCGEAVRAAATIAFIGLKQGFFTNFGINYSGAIYCDNLALPEQVFSAAQSFSYRLSKEDFVGTLLPRARDAHKGLFGHVLIVGGDEGYSGAPYMAAQAALRIGAGAVTIATHPSHAHFINNNCPEIMVQAIARWSDLKDLLKRATVVVLGPGMIDSSWGEHCFSWLTKCKLPMVVDAGALRILAAYRFKRQNWILTPHPGEAAELLHDTTVEIQKYRFESAKRITEKYQCTTVLKGADTIIKGQNNSLYVCDLGNPGMATAGMGDVLSGVIAGLLAQGLELDVAACMGVYLHAKAGDMAAKQNGEVGMLATDLLPYLHALINT